MLPRISFRDDVWTEAGRFQVGMLLAAWTGTAVVNDEREKCNKQIKGGTMTYQGRRHSDLDKWKQRPREQ